MHAGGLLVAHQEATGVKPVASDIDAFLIGSKGQRAGPALPPEQVALVH